MSEIPIPERIWLDWNNWDNSDLIWWTDEPKFTDDVEYVIATKCAELEAENAQMRDALEIIAKAKGDPDKIVCLATIKYCADIAKDAIEATKEGE